MSSAGEYWVGPTIGEGAFGHVVYAVHKTTQRKVAIKVMEASTPTHSRQHHQQQQQQQQQQKTAIILNERRILSLPELKSSKWIVDLWAAFCDDNNESSSSSSSSSSRCVYFVMELATGGDLKGLIERGLNNNTTSTTTTTTSNRTSWRRHSVPHYASQLITAVDFLHSKAGILHCDLKPENVLLDATTGQLRLADFGCALDMKQIQQQQQQQKQKQQSLFPRGTARYSAPEILRAELPSTLTEAVDYWSVGCILHAMLHGRSPFDRDNSEALTVRAIFDYVAADGGSGSGSGSVGGNFSTAAAAAAGSVISDESNTYNNDNGENDNDDHCNADKIVSSATLPTAISTKNDIAGDDDNDPLQLLSQGLLSVIPTDRIGFWTTNVIPLLFLKSHNDDSGEAGNGGSRPGKNSHPFIVTSSKKNILLPIPD